VDDADCPVDPDRGCVRRVRVVTHG
jgi:hypothetical protein